MIRRLGLLLLTVLLLFLVWGPLVALVQSAFWVEKTVVAVDGETEPQTEKEFDLTSVKKTLGHRRTPEVTLNTIKLGVTTTAFCLLIGVPLAYLLARFRLPWSNGLHLMLILPFIMPAVICTFAWMLLRGGAGGKIEQKIVRGEPLPEGWVIDQEGNYVTDGEGYRDQSTGVLPLGGLQFGHKGHGLAMMVEMLVGPLSHAGCTKGKRGGGGIMVLAIDIESFTDLDTYVEEVEGLASWVCSARPLPGVNKVYAPGEIEEETRQRRLVEGIEIPEATWQQIGEVASELVVAMPVVESPY